MNPDAANVRLNIVWGVLLVVIVALCVFVRMLVRQNQEHEVWRSD